MFRLGGSDTRAAVLKVAAGEGDRVELDGISLRVPLGHVWLEAMVPFERAEHSLAELVRSWFDAKLILYKERIVCKRHLTSGYYRLVRTSRDFGPIPIDMVQRVSRLGTVKLIY